MAKVKISDVIKFISVFLVILEKYLILVLKTPTAVAYPIYIFVAISIVIVNYKVEFYRTEINKYIILFVGSIVFTVISGVVDVFVIFMLVLLFRGDKLEKFLKYFLISNLICWISTIILSHIGFVQNKVLSRELNGVITVRNTLGFHTTNLALMSFFGIVISGFIIVKKKVIFSIVAALASTYIYIQTGCRTGYFMIIIAILFYNLESVLNKLNIAKFNYKYSFILFTIISIIIALIFGDISNPINILLSNRTYFWKEGITNLKSLNLFYNIDSDKYILDNIYLYIWYKFGIICYLVYNYFYIKASVNIKSYKVIVALMLYLIYGIFEANFTYDINISIYILMYYYMNSKELKNEKGTNGRSIK